jgi:hypothetical protein
MERTRFFRVDNVAFVKEVVVAELRRLTMNEYRLVW